MDPEEEFSLLDKIDAYAPASLKSFDAFPKLPSTYRPRSSERGFLTLFIAFIAFLLVANDIGEFLWGWPDFEFGVDYTPASFLDVNVDLIVNMPCNYLSVDLRDAVGDRLYLSKGFHRDGTLFDIGQATALKEHAAALTARQAIAESRKSRGFLSGLFRRSQDLYKPTYNYLSDGSACRIYGSLTVKRVTGAFVHYVYWHSSFIRGLPRQQTFTLLLSAMATLATFMSTTGVGITICRFIHTTAFFTVMNLSHIITEFSFGKHFPEITQPLDNSFEITHDDFIAYQYFLRVVPTTYVAPRSNPLHTNQYSVTHYERKLSDHASVPGIFFKFDIEPVRLTVIQRTTTLAQFFIRWAGVVGGVFVCASWALRATDRVITAVAGPDDTDSIAPMSDSTHRGGLRNKWTGTALRSRPSDASMRAGSWVDGSGGSPYSSTYSGSSYAGSPGSPMLPHSPYSPVVPPSLSGRTSSGFAVAGSTPGLGLSPSLFGPHLPSSVRTPATAATIGSPAPGQGTPSYGHFPPTPRSPLTGLPALPIVRDAEKKDD